MRAIMAVLGLLWAGSVYAADTVDVLYAGSLVNLMEHGIGPAFEQAQRRSLSGLRRRLEGAGCPDQGTAAAR